MLAEEKTKEFQEGGKRYHVTVDLSILTNLSPVVR